MHEADDVYMGYAGNDELIAALRTLMALAADDNWRDLLSIHVEMLSRSSAADKKTQGDASVGSRHQEVVKTLKSILPRVRNYRLHADLTDMLRDYETRAQA